MGKVALEPAAAAFAENAAKGTPAYQMNPVDARKILDNIQAAPIKAPAVDDKWVTVPASVGDVRVRIVRPAGLTGVLPTILYMHGGGWVLGNARTHDRLVRELSAGARAAVAFVEYTPSPDARYPVAIEQGYATAQWIARHGVSEGLDPARLAVAGESVGGNMAAALTLLAKERGDVRFIHQSLYYPVTDASRGTGTYREFSDGPYLTARLMEWFWDNYIQDPTQRDEIYASPIRATREQLVGLPSAFVVVDEGDVLRDEGEAYAAKLRDANVPVTAVRYLATVHDFMMLNPLRETQAASSAIAQAIQVLRQALGTGAAHPPNG